MDSRVRERDLRQLLLHRWHLVRMRVKNQLQHITLFLISRMVCNPCKIPPAIRSSNRICI